MDQTPIPAPSDPNPNGPAIPGPGISPERPAEVPPMTQPDEVIHQDPLKERPADPSPSTASPEIPDEGGGHLEEPVGVPDVDPN